VGKSHIDYVPKTKISGDVQVLYHPIFLLEYGTLSSEDCRDQDDSF
ncbi:MAG: hypothetical protein ACI90V_012572, partial [Bacillariaceae sp.]|jgi:hypothetical protein